MEFKLVRLAWDRFATRDLEPAMAHDPLAGTEVLAAGVMAGSMMLLGVYVEAERVGSLVLRPEEGDGTREMVLVAAGGRKPGLMLGPLVLPEVERLARDMGADTMRFHSARPAMSALAMRGGYFEAERVYRKVLI